jgi:hypothetical protein
MSALRWRIVGIMLLALLFMGKFLVLGPVRQIGFAEMNAHLAKVLPDAGAENVKEVPRIDQSGLRQCRVAER